MEKRKKSPQFYVNDCVERKRGASNVTIIFKDLLMPFLNTNPFPASHHQARLKTCGIMRNTATVNSHPRQHRALTLGRPLSVACPYT